MDLIVSDVGHGVDISISTLLTHDDQTLSSSSPLVKSLSIPSQTHQLSTFTLKLKVYIPLIVDITDGIYNLRIFRRQNKDYLIKQKKTKSTLGC